MMNPLSTVALDGGNEGWLYLCINLGVPDKFEELTRAIMTEMMVEEEPDGEGKKHTVYKRRRAGDKEKVVVDVDPIPEHVWKGILERRNDILEGLCKMMKMIPKRFENLDNATCFEPCNGICYGTYALSMKREKVWDYINLSKEERLGMNTTSSPSPEALHRAWKRATLCAEKAIGFVDHTEVLMGETPRTCCSNYHELNYHLEPDNIDTYLEQTWPRGLPAAEYIRPL